VSSEADLARLPARLLAATPYLMLEVLKLSRRRGVARAPGPEWRLPAYAVMAALDEFGPASQSEISRRLRYDPSDLVGVIDTLETAGWVVRDRDERDRRRHLLRFTDEGRRRMEERVDLGEEMLDTFLEPLEPAEREELHGLLLRLLEHHERFVAEMEAGA
jgi:DNA-binding MarR family transcriptional regulator